MDSPRQSVKRKLGSYTLETKYRAIKAVEEGSKRKLDIASEFNIKQNTLSNWLKDKDKIVANYEMSDLNVHVCDIMMNQYMK